MTTAPFEHPKGSYVGIFFWGGPIRALTPYLGLEMLLTAVLTAGVLTAVLVRDWSTKDSGPDRTRVRTPKDSRVRGPY